MGQAISEVKNQLRDSLCKKFKKRCLCFRLTVRNDKYDGKGKEIKAILKKKINDKNLSFTDNGNINPLC